MKDKLFKVFMVVSFVIGLFLPGIVLAEDTTDNLSNETHTVTVSARRNNSRLSNVSVMISKDGETIDYGTTNYSGNVSFELEDGTYHAVIGYVSGNHSYYGITEFTVDGSNTSVTVNVDRELNWDAAEEIYDDTSYFNHVDIRVNGEFTLGNVTYDVTIKNVSLLVKDGNNTIINTTFRDNTEIYEWRVTNKRVPKTAVVSLIFDIVLDGETIREDYTYSFSGKDDFVQAIIDCDQNQGLDFTIDPTEIIEEIFYNVSYQWSGLPEGLEVLPETVYGYESGNTHDVDTEFLEKTYSIASDGTIYVFSGWQEWSNATDNHNNKEDLNSDSLEITHDTIIYGVWTKLEEDLDNPFTYIEIRKNIVGDVNPENLYFTITGPKDGTLEIPYSSFVNGVYRVPVYSLGNFTIEEHNGRVPGYSLVSSVSSTFDVVGNATNTKIVIDIDLSDVDGGTVDFTNTYTKKIGTPVNHYPYFLIEKADGNTLNSLSGAVFTLTSNDNQYVSVATNESGYTIFRNILPGTYTLVETVAPNGYHLSLEEHIVVVSLVSSDEVYDAEQDAFVTVNVYGVSVSPEEYFNFNSLRLTVFNEKITGSLTITKDFGTNSDLNKNNFTGKVTVIVSGNNYNETITLDSTNNWTVTLDNLELGNYTIKEVLDDAKVKGYELVVSYNNSNTDGISVNLSTTDYVENINIVNTYTMKIVDKHNSASIKINKVDSKNNALAGAEFGLYDIEGNLIDSSVSDENGVVVFEGFKEEATYIIKEISAPDNYKLNTTKYLMIISLKDNKTELVLNGDTYEKVYTWIVSIESNDFENGVLTVVNEKKTGKLVVSKTVEYIQEGEVISTPDTESNNEYTFIVTIDGVEHTITLKDGEVKVFENIEYGVNYSVVEVIPSDAKWDHVEPVNATGVFGEEEVSVDLVNTYEVFLEEEPPHTGVDSNLVYYFITIFGILGFAFTLKRYN